MCRCAVRWSRRMTTGRRPGRQKHRKIKRYAADVVPCLPITLHRASAHLFWVQVVKFKGAAGRAVFNAVFSRPLLISSELFLPGRTVFVFELEGADGPDLPTTLRRSKADCPPVCCPLLVEMLS